MDHATRNFRSFLAIPIPPEAQTRLTAWRIDAFREGGDGIRWVPEGNLHITLFFFGEQTFPWLEHVAEQMRSQLREKHSFGVALSAPVLLRPTGDQRNILVAYPEPPEPIINLRAALVHVLRNCHPDFESDESFTPHCTLGRTNHAPPLRSVTRPSLLLQVETVTFFCVRHSNHSVQYIPWRTLPLGQPSSASASTK